MFQILLAIAVILLIVQWLSCEPFKWRKKGIKWLMPCPLIGNTGLSLCATYYDFWLNFYKSYKGQRIVGFHLFTTPALLVRHPEVIKQILEKEGKNFLDRGLFSSHHDPFGRNLLMVRGEEWRTLRSKITPYLSPSRIQGMFPIIQSCVDTMCQQLSLQLKVGPVEMDQVTVKMSTDVIMATVFGLEGDALTNPDSAVFKMQAELLGFFFGFRILVGFLSPLIYRILRFKVLSKSSTEKIIDFVQRLLELRQKGIGTRADFMQGMVDLYNADKNSQIDKEYYDDGTKIARFNYKGVASQCMIMFAASTENIGRNLGFLFYELAVNPQIQDKLRDEIFSIKSSNKGTIGYEQLCHLKYMDMVISESLRKYPPVISISRKSTTTTQIDNLTLKKGTLIAISIIGIHRDANYYPDPEKFDPERFAPGVKREMGTYLPFGLGPKGCVGIRLTQVEMKLALSEVLSKFKLTPCSDTPKTLEYHYGPTLRSTNGIKLNITLL